MKLDRRLLTLLACAALAACSRSEPIVAEDASVEPPPEPPVPARTTLTPPPGPFNGTVAVTLATDKPATIFLTTDGSDPRSSASTRAYPAPASLTLEQTTALSFYSRTPEGADEPTQTAQYLRAGGPSGSISGVVVVGEVAAGNPLLVDADGEATEIAPVAEAGEIPFLIEGLGSGTHRLSAFADRNGDGMSLPFVDLQSDTVEVELDLSNPFTASVEGVTLYLAQSQPDLCTIRGTVFFSAPVPGQTLMVAALSPDLFGEGADLAGLWDKLDSGYKVITNETDVAYPYVITDLEPGSYLAVPALGNLGGGLALNLIFSPMGQRTLQPGEEAVVDFVFGAVTLGGSATLPPGQSPFAYGVVAARNASLTQMSIQAVLMPTLYLPSETGLRGSFGAKALRENEVFSLRAFSNLDPADPFTSALTWVLNPFPPEPAQATVFTGTPEVTADFVAEDPPAP